MPRTNGHCETHFVPIPPIFQDEGDLSPQWCDQAQEYLLEQGADLQAGDLVCAGSERDYRNESATIFDGVRVRPLYSGVDEYGSVPPSLLVIDDEWPVGYWAHSETDSLDGSTQTLEGIKHNQIVWLRLTTDRRAQCLANGVTLGRLPKRCEQREQVCYTYFDTETACVYLAEGVDLALGSSATPRERKRVFARLLRECDDQPIPMDAQWSPEQFTLGTIEERVIIVLDTTWWSAHSKLLEAFEPPSSARMIDTPEELQIMKLEKLLQDETIPLGLQRLGSCSERSLRQARRSIARQMVEILMPGLLAQKVPPEVIRNARKDLNQLNPYRNSKLGLGNLSSGYLILQPAELEHNGYRSIEELGAQIAFDENPCYQVILDLILHPDNSLLLDRYWAALPADLPNAERPAVWMVPSETIKDVCPNPGKGFTKQVATPLHRDTYPKATRIQGYINQDEGCKLFFVPRSQDPRVVALLSSMCQAPCKEGFQKIIPKPEYVELLIPLLLQYAVSPNAGELLLWESGVLHFEGEASTEQKRLFAADRIGEGDYWRCLSTTPPVRGQRRRYFLGAVEIGEISQTSLQQLALAAEQGLTPCCYGENRGLPISRIIVSSKNTLYKVPRAVPESFVWDRQERLDSILSDPEQIAQMCLECIPDPRRRRLYGLQI